MRFLITAGPTREPLDPVRYLSNRSSGKMGYALARAALGAGHGVTLVSGPVNLEPPPGAITVPAGSSDEMFDAVQANLAGADIVVMCAAVADFKPVWVSPTKIKKHTAARALELQPTRDILAALGAGSRNYLLVGFAAETEELAANAQKKLREKNCDLVVANDVSGRESGMESDENEVIVFFRDGQTRRIPRDSKENIARELVKIFLEVCEK